METGYDYFGARYYNSELGRWLSVDPLADKYPGWNPYNYTLNNPLKYVDPDGDSVSVITSGPTIGEAGKRSQNSLGGHTAIAVDGNTYSFEGDGNWSIYPTENYIQNESQERTVIIQTVDVNQNSFQEALDNRQNGTYDVNNNSCVSNTMNVFSLFYQK